MGIVQPRCMTLRTVEMLRASMNQQPPAMIQRPQFQRPILITCGRATSVPVPKPAWKPHLEAKVLPARVLEADIVQLDEGRLQFRGLRELKEDCVVAPAPWCLCCSIAVIWCGGALLLLLLSKLGALCHLQILCLKTWRDCCCVQV